MAKKLSLNAKLYRGTAGSAASTEVTTCRDVSLNLTRDEIDVSNRATAWKQVQAGLIDADFSVDFAGDASDTHLSALIAAFVAGTTLAFYIKDVSGGEGLDADFVILAMESSQGLKDAVGYRFRIKPTASTRTPSWH